jgi:MerR family copper efflux transcriptional regulator
MTHHEAVFTIGELARAASVSTPTIRYYEDIGLMPKARRTTAGRRFYTDVDLVRLTFLRRARDLGFPIERVRDLASLAIRPDADCQQVRNIAAETLEEVRARRQEIEAIEAQLAAFVSDCGQACCGGAVRDCVVLADLSSPASGRVATS